MDLDADKSSRPRIAVLGSVNMDLVARCARLPMPGETLTGESFAEIPGGKGANQAVAAQRAGGQVAMIGRLGNDGFANTLLENLSGESIETSGIRTTEEIASGLAMITVSNTGENQIIVIPGANGCLSTADVDRAVDQITQATVLLLQLEVPLEVVQHAIRIAAAAGTRVILDPAPVPPELHSVQISGEAVDGLFQVDLLCPNESEASALAGLPLDTPSDVLPVAERLFKLGAKNIVITLGKDGVSWFDGNQLRHFEPRGIDAVDSTAAGDAFAGALAVRWAETGNLEEAIGFGNVAGSIAASRAGAQPSLPHRDELSEMIAIGEGT
ncbi:MAG TPA: ribokinase [Planctomycetaceae bacterium]|nr:ribokinase [Planctomycetaceae bacterium]